MKSLKTALIGMVITTLPLVLYYDFAETLTILWRKLIVSASVNEFIYEIEATIISTIVAILLVGFIIHRRMRLNEIQTQYYNLIVQEDIRKTIEYEVLTNKINNSIAEIINEYAENMKLFKCKKRNDAADGDEPSQGELLHDDDNIKLLVKNYTNILKAEELEKPINNNNISNNIKAYKNNFKNLIGDGAPATDNCINCRSANDFNDIDNNDNSEHNESLIHSKVNDLMERDQMILPFVCLKINCMTNTKLYEGNTNEMIDSISEPDMLFCNENYNNSNEQHVIKYQEKIKNEKNNKAKIIDDAKLQSIYNELDENTNNVYNSSSDGSDCDAPVMNECQEKNLNKKINRCQNNSSELNNLRKCSGVTCL